jgi:hypothetical protein
MSILQNFSYSVSQAGLLEVDGISNYYRPVFASHGKLQRPVLEIYLLDSHDEVKDSMKHRLQSY